MDVFIPTMRVFTSTRAPRVVGALTPNKLMTMATAITRPGVALMPFPPQDLAVSIPAPPGLCLQRARAHAAHVDQLRGSVSVRPRAFVGWQSTDSNRRSPRNLGPLRKARLHN